MKQFLTFLAGTALCALLAISAHAAEPNDRAVVHIKDGQPVLTASTGTCVRTKWLEGHDVCQPQQIVIQKKRVELSQEERTIYFAFNAASLSPDAKSRLDTLATNIKSQNDVRGARVVGFADRIGTPGYNEKLSKKRAENVKNYLADRGIINASIADTRWFGASMPATSCPNNLSRPQLIECLQKDRRVEVEIDYLPEVVAGR